MARLHTETLGEVQLGLPGKHLDTPDSQHQSQEAETAVPYRDRYHRQIHFWHNVRTIQTLSMLTSLNLAHE